MRLTEDTSTIMRGRESAVQILERTGLEKRCDNAARKTHAIGMNFTRIIEDSRKILPLPSADA